MSWISADGSKDSPPSVSAPSITSNPAPTPWPLLTATATAAAASSRRRDDVPERREERDPREARDGVSAGTLASSANPDPSSSNAATSAARAFALAFGRRGGFGAAAGAAAAPPPPPPPVRGAWGGRAACGPDRAAVADGDDVADPDPAARRAWRRPLLLRSAAGAGDGVRDALRLRARCVCTCVCTCFLRSVVSDMEPLDARRRAKWSSRATRRSCNLRWRSCW